MSRTTGHNLKPHEFYPTPVPLVQAFMQSIKFRPSDEFCEPCRGDGAIYDQVPLPDSQKSYCEIQDVPPKDYLRTHLNPVDVIITNPPFSLFESFLLKSMTEIRPDGTIAYLLRINVLGSKKRRLFWQIVGRPTHMITCVPRPSFTKGGTDSCEYAWFVWDYGNRIQADQIDWCYWNK